MCRSEMEPSLYKRHVPRGWVCRLGGVWEKGLGLIPSKKVKLTCPNRKASTGCLPRMVKTAYIRNYIVYSKLDAERSGEL